MKKNIMVAIQETETRVRYYVAIDSDIATGKCLAYNPETGCKIITPYKERNAFQTVYINKHPFDWMINLNTEEIEIPEEWIKLTETEEKELTIEEMWEKKEVKTMLDYSFFYDLSSYLNEHWNGSFTEKEVAQNAYDYLSDYEISKKENRITENLQILINGLKEDVKNNPDSESLEFLEMIDL